jgi:hypothetical protein
MSWISGSGLGNLLRGLVTNASFQQSALSAIQAIGAAVLAKKDDPAALKIIADNLKQNAPAVLGAMVKNTEVEAKVDESVVKAADKIAAVT